MNQTNPLVELRKTSVFSGEYEIEERGLVVGKLTWWKWRWQGELTAARRDLKLKKQGVFKDTFTLSDGDSAILQVEQPSFWRTKLVFHFESQDFELRCRSWYGSTMVVKSNGSVIGTVSRRGLFTGGAKVDLPARLPLAVRVFLGWIAMFRWNKAASASAT